jgi:hypothetical protein
VPVVFADFESHGFSSDLTSSREASHCLSLVRGQLRRCRHLLARGTQHA